MIIDCFPFFNELDLLEIRLNSLAPYVDRFVLAECPVTHSGNPKPLYFAESKDRFKDFNITHLIVQGYEQCLGTDPWNMEKYQREYLMQGMKDAGLGCTILLSDLDEIPDLKNYNEGTEGVFVQQIYRYYLNTFILNDENWHGTVARLRKNFKRLNDMRNHKNVLNQIGEGWHFSTIGSPDQITYKIESFAHQEFNTDEFKGKIRDGVDNLIHPFGTSWEKGTRLTVGMPSGPEWLLRNKDKYQHLFYGSNNGKNNANFSLV